MDRFHLSKPDSILPRRAVQRLAVHPLDAPPEQKMFRSDIGRMALTPSAKMALFVLQGYLGVMVLLVGWRLIAGT
jgi:hypothetical protein